MTATPAVAAAATPVAAAAGATVAPAAPVPTVAAVATPAPLGTEAPLVPAAAPAAAAVAAAPAAPAAAVATAPAAAVAAAPAAAVAAAAPVAAAAAPVAAAPAVAAVEAAAAPAVAAEAVPAVAAATAAATEVDVAYQFDATDAEAQTDSAALQATAPEQFQAAINSALAAEGATGMSVQGVSGNVASMEDIVEEQAAEGVHGSFSLTVPDAAAFSSNEGVLQAVTAAIAQVAFMDPSQVAVTLAGGARRLQGESHDFRRLTGSVLADYSIPSAGASALASLGACDPLTMMSAINTNLASLGLTGFAVTDLSDMTVSGGSEDSDTTAMYRTIGSLINFFYSVYIALIFVGVRDRFQVQENTCITVLKSWFCLPCFITQVLGHIEHIPQSELLGESYAVE